ncbi:MAG: hypothetical protein Q9213_005549 [Squamulea squamosa]
MAEPVPNINPDTAHELFPVDKEGSEAIPDSSNASTQLKPDSDATSDNANEKAPPGEQPEQVRKITGIKWVLVVVSILSSTFLYALDNTVVADVQPKIVDRFGEIQKLPWLPISFLVACVATNLIWGKIYGQLNAKWLYIACVFLFEVGSALCGAAPTMNALIGGRVLAGMGGAGFGIALVHLLTFLQVFIGALCAPVLLFMLPPFDPRPGVPYRKRLSELDYLGTLLMVGACVAGVMAINFGGIIYPWNSGETISCFVVSGVLFIAFGLQQSFCVLTTEETRIFPCQFVKNKSLIILFVQMSANVTIFFVPIYFIPLFFQFARNDSAILAGVRLLPLICLMVTAVILNGALMSKYGYYMPWYLVGGCIALIGSALMYTVKLDTSTSKIYGYTALLGIGSGMYGQAGFSVAQAKVRPHEIPLAIGFVSLAQISGATTALAIANSIFLNQATNDILAIMPYQPRNVVQGAVSGAGSNFFQTLDASVKTAVLEAVTRAISQIYILAITAAALTVVLAVFMSREKVGDLQLTLFPFHWLFNSYSYGASGELPQMSCVIQLFCVWFVIDVADCGICLAFLGTRRSWLKPGHIDRSNRLALHCIT